jgi:hypothetical protein
MDSPILGGYAMNVRKSWIVPGLATLWLSPAAAQAQSINPPTAPQTSPAMTEPEKRNLTFVLDWWREVIQGAISTCRRSIRPTIHSAQPECADGACGLRQLL